MIDALVDALPGGSLGLLAAAAVSVGVLGALALQAVVATIGGIGRYVVRWLAIRTVVGSLLGLGGLGAVVDALGRLVGLDGGLVEVVSVAVSKLAPWLLPAIGAIV